MSNIHVNPVGEAKVLPQVETLIQTLAVQWEETKDATPKWWQFWKKGTGFYQATAFLLGAVDELVNLVENLIPKGVDKKATVLAALDILWDYVVREAIPIWAKPFAGRIKHFVIFVVVSTSIDFMVQKYREGVWNSEAIATEPTKELPNGKEQQTNPEEHT